MSQMLQCELLFLVYVSIIGLIAWFATPWVLWVLILDWECQCQTDTEEIKHDKKI